MLADSDGNTLIQNNGTYIPGKIMVSRVALLLRLLKVLGLVSGYPSLGFPWFS